MKKKIIILNLSVLAVFLFLSVGYVEYDAESNNASEVKDLEFEVIEELPEELEKPIAFVQKLKGFGLIKREGQESIIYIGLGEKPTGGYRVSVESVKEVDGTTKIEIAEISPDPDQLVTQALTYPMTVIRVFAAGDEIKVVNQAGEELEDINDETKEAEYIENK